MSFGLSAAAIGGIAAGVGAVGGAAISASAARKASGQQADAAYAGIDEQARQFDKIRDLLDPYVQAGYSGLDAQRALLGLNGPQAAQDAVNALKTSPVFTSALQAGTNAILSNASATGGLRGGNTQDALSRYSGDLLSKVIQSQIGNLGGITTAGQNAAAGVGTAAQNTGNNVATLLGQVGSAQAGGTLATGNAVNAGINGIVGAIGTGLGGFSGTSGMPGAVSPVTGINSGVQYSGLSANPGGFGF